MKYVLLIAIHLPAEKSIIAVSFVLSRCLAVSRPTFAVESKFPLDIFKISAVQFYLN
jgi:hypothetical protein